MESQNLLAPPNYEDLDSLTDVEDLESEGEKTPLKDKISLPVVDVSAPVTDTENLDASEDDDDVYDLPLNSDKEIKLPEYQEVVSTTEGFEHDKASTNQLGNKHRVNLQRVDTILKAIELSDDDQLITDDESLDASEDDLAAPPPEYPVATAYFLKEDSSHEVTLRDFPSVPTTEKKKLANNLLSPKSLLAKSDGDEVVTDIEDLSDASHKLPSKPTKKRKTKRKLNRNKKSLNICITDFDSLVVTSASSSELEKEQASDLTDEDSINISECSNLFPEAILKDGLHQLPELHNHFVQIRERQQSDNSNEPLNTDEEHVAIDESTDHKHLQRSVKIYDTPVYKEPTLIPSSLEVEFDDNYLTDAENLSLDEQEEAEIVEDLTQNVISSDILTKMDFTSTNTFRSEFPLTNRDSLPIVDNDCKVLTDIEEMDQEGNLKKVCRSSKQHRFRRRPQNDNHCTDSDTVDDSDEDVISKSKLKSKLPPQLSEIRFFETDHGSISVVVTPDRASDEKLSKDSVKGVIFLSSEDEGGMINVGDDVPSGLAPYRQNEEPVTDVDEYEADECARPDTPLPVIIKENTTMQSPRRELVKIKEDQYGIPQITIEKLPDGMLGVPEPEENALTDTEEVGITLEEALRLDHVPSPVPVEHDMDGSSKTVYHTPSTKTNGMKSAHNHPVLIIEDDHSDPKLLSGESDSSFDESSASNTPVHTGARQRHSGACSVEEKIFPFYKQTPFIDDEEASPNFSETLIHEIGERSNHTEECEHWKDCLVVPNWEEQTDVESVEEDRD